MLINQKIELILDDEEQEILDSQSRMCNKLYNLLLDSINNEQEEHLFSGRKLRDKIVSIKKLHPYLYSVHSSPLKNVAFRLKEAYIAFFNKTRGMPHYRSFGKKWFSLFYDEPNKGIKIEGKKIRISFGYKLDENEKKIRLYVNGLLKEPVLKNGQIRNYRITKEMERYYVIVCLEKEYTCTRAKTGKTISIDPNHTNFFVGMDNEGNSIEMEKLSMTRYFDNKIDEIKSKRDHCKKKSIKCTTIYGSEYWKSSHKYDRYQKTLKKLYAKRDSQIKTALYTIANKLCNQYDTIAIGNYVPNASNITAINHTIIAESEIGKFRRILEHVCNKRGVTFIKVDEYNTTKECFICGNLESKAPSIRTYTCPCCKHTYNRDINSAINIGKKANILSCSDYFGLDLTKPKYAVKYNLNQQITLC